MNEEIIKFINNLPRVLDENGGIATMPNANVISNAIAFIEHIPTYYQRMLNPIECITATGHGTITIDFYYKKNFVSVEIGNTLIGFFSETPDGLNPSSSGMKISEKYPAIISCLDKVYKR